MTGFEPGEGWREVSSSDALQGRDQIVLYPNGGRTADRRYWVREDPVVPLPIEPHTVIRVHWREPGTYWDDVLVLRRSREWGLNALVLSPSDLAKRIAGFEVLAEPRAVTLDAALARAVDFLDQAWEPGALRVLSYDLQQALFAEMRDGASS